MIRATPALQAWQDDDACGLDLFVAAAEQGRGVGPAGARDVPDPAGAGGT